MGAGICTKDYGALREDDSKEENKALRKELEELKEALRQKTEQIDSLSKFPVGSPQAFLDRAINVLKLTNDKKERPVSDTEVKAQLVDLLEDLVEEIQPPKVQEESSMTKVISKSKLDEMTKKWLTSEFTRSDALALERDHKKGSLILPASMALLGEIESWDFDVCQYNPQLCSMYVFKIFQAFGLVGRFEINGDVFNTFLHEVMSGYNSGVPYHNYYHAVDVLHCVFMYLKTSDVIAKARLRSIDLLVILLSALAHDIGHPGTNNTYQNNTETELSLIYNDQSVLENFHAATLFGILKKKECNILISLDKADRGRVRKAIISCILATDMTSHFAMVAKVDPLFSRLLNASATAEVQTTSPPTTPHPTPLNISSSSSTSASSTAPLASSTSDEKLSAPKLMNRRRSADTISLLSNEDLQHVLNVLLHAADISNVTKPWSISKKWSDKLAKEFYSQGDLEREKGLPISPFMDRNSPTQNRDQAQMSLNFIDFIVAPLLASIVNAFPGLTPAAQHLTGNRQKWHDMLMDNILTRERTLSSIGTSSSSDSSSVSSQSSSSTTTTTIVKPPTSSPTTTSSTPSTAPTETKETIENEKQTLAKRHSKFVDTFKDYLITQPPLPQLQRPPSDDSKDTKHTPGTEISSGGSSPGSTSSNSSGTASSSSSSSSSESTASGNILAPIPQNSSKGLPTSRKSVSLPITSHTPSKQLANGELSIAALLGNSSSSSTTNTPQRRESPPKNIPGTPITGPTISTNSPTATPPTEPEKPPQDLKMEPISFDTNIIEDGDEISGLATPKSRPIKFHHPLSSSSAPTTPMGPFAPKQASAPSTPYLPNRSHPTSTSSPHITHTNSSTQMRTADPLTDSKFFSTHTNSDLGSNNNGGKINGRIMLRRGSDSASLIRIKSRRDSRSFYRQGGGTQVAKEMLMFQESVQNKELPKDFLPVRIHLDPRMSQQSTPTAPSNFVIPTIPEKRRNSSQSSPDVLRNTPPTTATETQGQFPES